MKKEKKQTLLWMDLEMTGLNIQTDVILEIATLVTDDSFSAIAQGLNVVIHQSDTILEKMDKWCTNQHTKSGLVEAVRSSPYSVEQAEQLTIDFIKQFCAKHSAILCGNSIWQDRVFAQKYMPNLAEYFHYKMIDVTSIQQVIKRWYPNNPNIEFKKQDQHRALVDIQESIAELLHYKTHFMIP